MTTCDKNEALRDYAFDELPAGAAGDRARREMEQHLVGCGLCATELDQLRVTTAALRALPEQEVPRRIAFVSDKIFNPSPLARFLAALPKYAALAVAAVALVVAVQRPAPEVVKVVTTASGADVSKQIDEAVGKAVSQVRAEVKAEDARITTAALAEAEVKHEREHRMLVAAMEQSIEVMQKRMNAATSLASLEAPQNGGGQ
jgi:hypothetical protein